MLHLVPATVLVFGQFRKGDLTKGEWPELAGPRRIGAGRGGRPNVRNGWDSSRSFVATAASATGEIDSFVPRSAPNDCRPLSVAVLES